MMSEMQKIVDDTQTTKIEEVEESEITINLESVHESSANSQEIIEEKPLLNISEAEISRINSIDLDNDELEFQKQVNTSLHALKLKLLIRLPEIYAYT